MPRAIRLRRAADWFSLRENNRINGEAIMSSITADGLPAPAAGGDIGPLEQKHLQYANYRAVASGTNVSKTHWHIAVANTMGWGFDGMDGVNFALIAPMVIKEVALTVPQYRAG